MAKMKQEVITEPGKIIFRDVDIPIPGPNQVLVKIHRIGVCGSDIHVFHGQHPYTKYPVTQGHEVSGEIAGLGEYADRYAVGQRVVIEPQVFCGHCHPCLHGKYNLCEELKVMGFQTVGAASEYFAVDESKVTPISDNMSYDQGAMMEPLAVAVHAARRFGNMNGVKVCIEGCGPIGLLLAQVCKAMGADRVMITDVSDIRLELAKSIGIDEAVNTAKEDFGKVLIRVFGPDKADVIYDCAGSDITMNAAIQNARKGSMIILVAVFAKQANIDLAKLNDSEIDLNTSMMYRHEDFVEAIRLASEGKLVLEPLMSNHFTFDKYAEAYRYIDENRERTMKVLIDMEQEG